MKIKYGIVAVSRKQVDEFASIEDMNDRRFMEKLNTLNILGFTGYEEEPTGVTYMSLYHEYKNDPEHGLENIDVVLIPANEEVLADLKKDMPDMF